MNNDGFDWGELTKWSQPEGEFARIETPADLREFAKITRQMYVSLRQEGFNERQALILIGQVLSANMSGGS